MPQEAERALDDGASRFQLDVLPDRERVIVVPAGEIDLATAPRMEGAVADLLERGFRQVVVDLRQVDFMDSQGIRALVNANDRARDEDAMLSLILGKGVSRSVLELCGVLPHFNVAG